MKRTVCTIAIVALLGTTSVLHAQSLGNTQGATGTVCTTLVFPSLSVSGSFLAVWFGSADSVGATAISAISDTNQGSATWHQLALGGADANCPGSFYKNASIWYSANHPAGSTVVTLTLNNGSISCNNVAVVGEFSGVGSVVAETPPTVAQFSGTVATTTAFTPTGTQMLQLADAFYFSVGSRTAGPTNSFLNAADQAGVSFGSIFASYRFDLSAASTQTSWTSNVSSNCGYAPIGTLDFSNATATATVTPTATATATATATRTATATATVTGTPSVTQTPTATATTTATATPQGSSDINIFSRLETPRGLMTPDPLTFARYRR